MSGKRTDFAEFTKHFHGKYQETIHVDNKSLLITYTGKHIYNNIDLEDTTNWSGSILKILEDNEIGA